MPLRAAASTGSAHDLPARRAESAQRSDDPVRAELMEAMLVAAGKQGYRQVSIKSVLELHGGHRVQFWQHFANKEECFAAAYAAWADRLVADLLAAAAVEEDWAQAVRAALVALFGFVETRVEIARALLIEAEIAGGAALAKREKVIEHLGGMLEVARGPVDAGERPPPLTGIFVAGGIATYVSDQLAAGTPEAIWAGLPELMRFAAGPYLGKEAAEAEFEAAATFLERRGRGEELE